MHIVIWHIFQSERLANLPKEKPRLLFGLAPKMPDPVPEGILDPSVNQTRESSGTTGSAFLQFNYS
jgi:hypothetical protein